MRLHCATIDRVRQRTPIPLVDSQKPEKKARTTSRKNVNLVLKDGAPHREQADLPQFQHQG